MISYSFKSSDIIKKVDIYIDCNVNHIRKRPLGRPRRIWEDNIRTDLKKISINTSYWVDVAVRDRN